MKDLIVSLILATLLIQLFSTVPMVDMLPSGGVGTQYAGDRGMVLPGGGADMAEVIVQKQMEERQGLSEDADEHKTEEIPTKTEMEVKSKMENVVLAFWHGVATVLLGETVALMVAVAWIKIRGKDNG